ncbi:UNVERIFIED_CONTAM: Gibberellin 2-beta-dioxygenase 1, partial [Sesamum latifolium]
CAVIGYVEAVKELACEVLDLIGEGLGGVHPPSLFSGLIRDVQSDCVLRLNHYHPVMWMWSRSASVRLGLGSTQTLRC